MNERTEDRETELIRLREENEKLRQALVAAETRKGIHLGGALDWEEEKRKADALLEPLRGGPLGRRLAVSAAVHAGLVLLTSLGFIYMALKFGSLDPRKAAAEAEKEAVPVEAPAEASPPWPPEAPAVPESAEINAAKERVEQSLRETSSERPVESKVDLFGSDIDL